MFMKKLNVVLKPKVLEFFISSYMLFNYTSTIALINQKKNIGDNFPKHFKFHVLWNNRKLLKRGFEKPYTILGQSSLCKCFF